MTTPHLTVFCLVMLLPEHTSSQCGPPHFRTPNGQIASTKFTGSSNMQCIYTIHSADPVPVIVPQINIPTMSMEAGGSGCQVNNSLVLYDGDSTEANEMIRYCGRNPAMIPVWSRADLTIRYQTSSDADTPVFKILFGYDAIIESNSCSSKINVRTQNNDGIQSVNFPASYLSDLDCYWLVQWGPSDFILRFASFALPQPIHGQCKDYLRVYTGSLSYTYCGTQLARLIVNTNRIFLHFHSDSYDDDDGSTGFSAIIETPSSSYNGLSFPLSEHIPAPSQTSSYSHIVSTTPILNSAVPGRTSTDGFPTWTYIVAVVIIAVVIIILMILKKRTNKSDNEVQNDASAKVTPVKSRSKVYGDVYSPTIINSANNNINESAYEEVCPVKCRAPVDKVAFTASWLESVTNLDKLNPDIPTTTPSASSHNNNGTSETDCSSSDIYSRPVKVLEDTDMVDNDIVYTS